MYSFRQHCFFWLKFIKKTKKTKKTRLSFVKSDFESQVDLKRFSAPRRGIFQKIIHIFETNFREAPDYEKGFPRSIQHYLYFMI